MYSKQLEPLSSIIMFMNFITFHAAICAKKFAYVTVMVSENFCDMGLEISIFFLRTEISQERRIVRKILPPPMHHTITNGHDNNHGKSVPLKSYRTMRLIYLQHPPKYNFKPFRYYRSHINRHISG
jgi:hypothetical protein